MDGREVILINGGTWLGEVQNAMSPYIDAFKTHTPHIRQFGLINGKLFDHSGGLSNKVNPKNIDYLHSRFSDWEKDAIIGWSMGADTAAQYLLETDKSDFSLVILDGGVILTPEQIREISGKTEKLIIAYHTQDQLGSGIAGISWPRNYDWLGIDVLKMYKELEKELGNFKLIAIENQHSPVPDELFNN